MIVQNTLLILSWTQHIWQSRKLFLVKTILHYSPYDLHLEHRLMFSFAKSIFNFSILLLNRLIQSGSNVKSVLCPSMTFLSYSPFPSFRLLVEKTHQNPSNLNGPQTPTTHNALIDRSKSVPFCVPFFSMLH